MINRIYLREASMLSVNCIGIAPFIDERLESFYGAEIDVSGSIDIAKVYSSKAILDSLLVEDFKNMELTEFLLIWYDAFSTMIEYPDNILPYFEVYHTGIKMYKNLYPSHLFQFSSSILDVLLLNPEMLIFLSDEDKKDFEGAHFITLDIYIDKIKQSVRQRIKKHFVDRCELEECLSFCLLVLHAFYQGYNSIFEDSLDIYNRHLKEDIG